MSKTELLHGLAVSVAEAQRELELDHAEYDLAEAVVDVKVSLHLREADGEGSGDGRHGSPRVFGSIMSPGSAAAAGGGDMAGAVRLVLRPRATPGTSEWPEERAARASWS
ncbi:MAG: hypothetical protein M3326_04210 [Actinomycetota bacterium]|nr:hypothetical protein [Actinomycetota bacterium]